MADSPRAFVAIDVDEPLRRQVARVQSMLRAVAPGAKWVDPALCHITLKFLGYVPTEQLPAIADALGRAAVTARPFELTFRGVGAFPRWRGARVLWMGLGGGEATLVTLQATVEAELAPLGFKPEPRPFSPHLTLARFKQPPVIEEIAREFEQEPFGSVQVEELRLIHSDLRPSGPVYTLLQAHSLARRSGRGLG